MRRPFAYLFCALFCAHSLYFELYWLAALFAFAAFHYAVPFRRNW